MKVDPDRVALRRPLGAAGEKGTREAPNKGLELTEVTDCRFGGGSAKNTRLLNHNPNGSGTFAVK